MYARPTVRTTLRALLMVTGVTATLPQLALAQDVRPPAGAEVIDTIVVTGSSIRSQAGALETLAQPIQYVSEEQFTNTKAESVGDFLRTMPINNGFSSSPTTDEYAGGNTSINLRGIGDQYTLVLVEGRRFGGEDTPDVGALPAEAIQGIEILKGGASAIYGSDAVAGVVNVRLKDDFEGLEFYGSYGDTTRQDAAFVRAAALFGLSGERFNLTGSISYQDREGITKFDRELTSSRDYRGFGGLDRRSGRVSTPHQIVRSSAPSQALSLDLSRFNAGSAGSANPADYVAFNRAEQAYSTNELGTYPPYDRLSGHWSGSYEVVEDKLTFFVRGYADDRHQDFFANPPIVDVFVPADNPYNPFGEEVHVWYLFGQNELGLMTETFDITNFLGTAGFRGSFGEFNYEVGYSRYQKRLDESYRNDINIGEAQAAAERTDASAFNPFGFWSNTPAQLAGLSPTSTFEQDNTVSSLDAKLDGKLFEWSGGTARFAVGVEHREVEFAYRPDQNWQDADYWWLGNGGAPAFGERDVDAYFGEIQLPLYEAASGGAFVQRAEVTGAIRQEEYSDFGSSTVGQIAGRVGFLDDTVILRASYAESFKAPSLDDLNEPTATNTEPGGFYFDPVRGGFFAVDRITGGNPNLDAESGETINFGLILRPLANSNLIFTFDYWALELSDIVAEPDGQALLNGIATGGSITRDPVTQYPTLDLRLDNGGQREVSGFDAGVTYRQPTDRAGTFTTTLNATYLTKFEDSNDGVSVEYLGTYNTTVGPMPRLRLVSGLQWGLGGWDAVATLHYTAGYDDVIPNVISREVESYTTFDLQAGYDFDAGSGTLSFLKGTRVYLGIDNVFDEDLPFVAASPDGWDRYLSDYVGRYAYAGIRKRF